MTDILVIGDVHIHPKYSHRRLTDLGLYIADEKPDIVVQIGDFADVSSITEHNTKLEFEGQRYKFDVESVLDAQADLFRPIRARKKKLPEFHMTLGNHDERVQRWVASHPQLEGAIGLEDFKYESFGWRVHPFLKRHKIQGWNFVHFVPTKMGKAKKSVHHGFGITKDLATSTIVGHSHEYHHYIRPYDGWRAHGIDVGCFTHKDFGEGEGWSEPNAYKYWNGVVWIRNASRGDGSVQQVQSEMFTGGC